MTARTGILVLGLVAGAVLPATGVAAPPDELPPTAQIPPQKPIVISDGRIGVSLQTMSAGLARSLGLATNTKGAVVSEVLDGKPASVAGLQPGDVIIEIDRKSVSTADEAAERLREQKDHELRVLNTNGARVVTLPAP